MDAVDILKICLRRWYVMLPILLGAVGVSYQMVEAQETTFTAAASYGLVQPGLSGVAGAGGEANPLGANGSDLVGAALEAQLNSREAQEQLGSEATRGWGPGEVANSSSYSVQIPLYETTYEVRAWGEDEQAVRDVVNRVVEAAPGIADELQSQVEVPAELRYEPFVLAPTQSETLKSTSGKKLVVAVMGVGVLMGAAWSIMADRARRVVLVEAARTFQAARPFSNPAPSNPAPSNPAPSNPASSKPPVPVKGRSKRSAISKRPAPSKRPPPGTSPRAAQQKEARVRAMATSRRSDGE